MIYAIGKFLAICANKIWFRITFKGKENIPKDTSMIICANHVSMYDPVAVASQIPGIVHYLGKEELFHQNWFVRFIMKSVHVIPVNRENVSLSTMRTALKLLKNKEKLGVFPEATRVRDGKPRPQPLPGFVVFALKAKVPILPVHLEGDFHFGQKATVTFGELIYLDAYYDQKLTSAQIQEISNRIMDDIYRLGSKK